MVPSNIITESYCISVCIFSVPYYLTLYMARYGSVLCYVQCDTMVRVLVFYGSGATLLYVSRSELSTFWCYVPLLFVTFWFVWSFVTYEREKRERERTG